MKRMYHKHLDTPSVCRNCHNITYPYWVDACSRCGTPHWDQDEYNLAQAMADRARTLIGRHAAKRRETD